MKFFEIYKEELSKDTFSADRLWNADESSQTVVHTPGRIEAKRGDKRVGVDGLQVESERWYRNMRDERGW